MVVGDTEEVWDLEGVRAGVRVEEGEGLAEGMQVSV